MSTTQDEDIRIYELPEVQELTAGMKVAVDSESGGTKSFDLSNLTGKVDEPETEPEAGQVLTFDGTENTWANPPEGVYVLKYSEVTDLDDVDLDKATTIPTFILIDSKQTLVIGNGSSGTTITVNAGTIMRLEEVGASDDAGKPMLLTFVNDYGQSATGGSYMTYGNYFVRLVVSKSMYGGVSKQFGVSADIWGSGLFRSQPVPVVKKYDIARGPAESSGSLNGDANSLIVSFEDTGSNKRRQLLPPAELASHDFANDETPEQIQFMGWGATSNRAGYKTLFNVASQVDNNAYPAQTPSLNLIEFVMGNPSGELDTDQRNLAIYTTLRDSLCSNIRNINYLFLPDTSNSIDANIVPNVPKYWTDSNGGHIAWKPVNEVPASTAQDEGKVLTVNSSGNADWSNISTSDFVLVTGSTGAEKATNCQAIIDAGKIPVYNKVIYDSGHPYNQIMVYMYSDDNNFYFMGINPKYYKDGVQQFIAYQNDVRITFYRTSKTTFANGYTERGLDDLLSDSVISSDANSINVRNNRLTIVPTSYTTGKSSLTINIVEGEMTNAVIELTPDTNMTVTVVKKGPSDITLKYSVAAGNTLEAGKYYQITAVGNCWTLAEFES